jgi:hypothetical protein
MSRPQEIKKAVETLHGYAARYICSVPIDDDLGPGVVWPGIVEVFELIGHPFARRCYAWPYREGDQKKFAAILGVGAVESAHSAVQLAIAAKAKKRPAPNPASVAH